MTCSVKVRCGTSDTASSIASTRSPKPCLPSTSTPEFESRYDLGCQVGSVATCADDTALLVAAQGGFHALDLRTGEVRLHAPVAVGRPDILMNDGKCDPAGRFVAGTMHRHAVPGQGQLLRHDSTTRLAVPLLDGVGISNGLAWTASGTTFYCIDSLQARVDRLTYDMDEGKVLSRQPAFRPARVYRDAGRHVDRRGGLSVDRVWRAGAVRRFGRDGQLLAELRVPVSRTTSCCFGGEDLRDLFITTARRSIRDDRLSDTEPLAGAVFRCRVDTPGAPTSHSRSDR
jgi:sugar lactone lactonase YvrE